MKLFRFAVPLALLGVALLVSAAALGGSPKPSVQFKNAGQTVTESGGSNGIEVNVPITISPKSGNASVTFTTQGGTATAGSGCSTDQTDYNTSSQTITFTAGGPTTKYGTVHICDNPPSEGPETVGLHLSNPTGVTLGSKRDAVLTINDNDAKPVVSIAGPALGATEGGSQDFTVSMNSTQHEVPVSVNYTTVNGTAAAPGDFTAKSGTITFPAGDNADKTVTVDTIDDSIDEPSPESYSVQLSSPSNATIGTGSGSANIFDNDDPPKFSVTNASANEGDPPTANTLTFNVSLSGPTAQDATVHWENSASGAHQASEGTSCSGFTDYVGGSGTLTFHPGDPLTQQVTIATCPDLNLENNETFSIALSSPTYASIDSGGNPGIGTIFNDDGCTYNFVEESPGAQPTAGPGFVIVNGSGTDTVDTISPDGPNNWPYWSGDVGKHVLDVEDVAVLVGFDQLQKSVSVMAALSDDTATLTMTAYDTGDNQVDQTSLTPGDTVQHQYSVGNGADANISYVMIGAISTSFAFRELSFTACPGP